MHMHPLVKNRGRKYVSCLMLISNYAWSPATGPDELLFPKPRPGLLC